MENRGCLTAYENCDDSWVVTTEGPRGPKCTESARALIGRSASNRRERAQGLWMQARGLGIRARGLCRRVRGLWIRALGLYKKSEARLKKGSAYTQQYEINTNGAWTINDSWRLWAVNTQKGNNWLRNLVRMGSIGIVWEYLIQYGNTKTGMVTKFLFEYKISADKILFKFAVKTMFGTDNVD